MRPFESRRLRNRWAHTQRRRAERNACVQDIGSASRPADMSGAERSESCHTGGGWHRYTSIDTFAGAQPVTAVHLTAAGGALPNSRCTIIHTAARPHLRLQNRDHRFESGRRLSNFEFKSRSRSGLDVGA